jgi:hypothetical protein
MVSCYIIRDYYFRHDGIPTLTKDTLPFYLEQVEQTLIDESTFAKSYLHPSTVHSLTRILAEELIGGKHMRLLLEDESFGCKVMLQEGLTDNLSRSFQLFSHLNNGLEFIVEIFKQHISNLLQGTIAEQASTSCSTSAANESTTVTIYEQNKGTEYLQQIKSLLDLLEPIFTTIIGGCFQGNQLFREAIKDLIGWLVRDGMIYHVTLRCLKDYRVGLAVDQDLLQKCMKLPKELGMSPYEWYERYLETPLLTSMR